MILVDTSVWVDHLRWGNRKLRTLLDENSVITHPFIVGELSCGALDRRTETLSLLRNLPHAMVAEHQDVLDLVERKHLHGSGIGWIDAHLLASALLERASIWTLDKHFSTAARSLGIG